MDVQLLLALALGIATIVFLVLRTRIDAFGALLLASLVTGLVAGQALTDILSSITTGFGNTLGAIGIVIGLGVAIGKILEVSGAADRLARAFLKAFGKGREPWAMASVGSVVSIPVFCDSGYVIMNPLARAIARVKRGGYITLALALGCGMTLTHHMVPPTPGPLAVAGIVGADLGLIILTGLVFTVILLPVVVSYAKWMGPKLEANITPEVEAAVFADGGRASLSGDADLSRLDEVQTYDANEHIGTPPEGESHKRIGTGLASLPLVLPLLLIVLNTVLVAVDRNAQGALEGGDAYEMSSWVEPFAFVGHPVIALLIGIILAVYVLLPRWTPRKQVHSWLADAAGAAGLILLITGAGGALGQVLRDSGVGDALAESIAATPLPAFFVPFIIATVVRLAQGSGTVAMITAASVTAPLIPTLGVAPLVVAMACTAGSMVFSYFNDSYFWVVTRFAGLEGTDALKGWSGITTAVWAGSIPLLVILNLVVG
ncbi:MAG: SLC13 family permease [Mobilicoccus sp.]|nr:SLC13 family permease [Mobilicoccus sp.]